MLALLIVLCVLIIFMITGLIVYFAIRQAGKSNRQYENFAKENAYKFDKGMVVVNNYRDHSRNTLKLSITIPNENPYINKYANFSSYPFGRGVEKTVAYVIEGEYKSVAFRAFTYKFTGSLLEKGGSGGVFGILMIKTEKEFASLPEETFYENGVLCHYVQGNLEVDKIKPMLDKLINL